MFFELEASV